MSQQLGKGRWRITRESSPASNAASAGRFLDHIAECAVLLELVLPGAGEARRRQVSADGDCPRVRSLFRPRASDRAAHDRAIALRFHGRATRSPHHWRSLGGGLSDLKKARDSPGLPRITFRGIRCGSAAQYRHLIHSDYHCRGCRLRQSLAVWCLSFPLVPPGGTPHPIGEHLTLSACSRRSRTPWWGSTR